MEKLVKTGLAQHSAPSLPAPSLRSRSLRPARSLRLAFGLAALAVWWFGGAMNGTALAQPDHGARPPSRAATASDGQRGARQEEPPDSFFAPIYRDFYDSYKLGPGDELAVRVARQPDYTLERIKVSPVGRIYHPLLGDIEVAGLTVEQLTNRLARDLGEYLLEPKVSVELLDANSAKIGVLGEVRGPGIIVLARPMTVLDALAAAGGVTDYGSRSNVSLLRPQGGRLIETRVNVKRLLEGKATLAENPNLLAGDTLIVHGNKRKRIGEITALVGFAQFVGFLARR